MYLLWLKPFKDATSDKSKSMLPIHVEEIIIIDNLLTRKMVCTLKAMLRPGEVTTSVTKLVILLVTG